VPRNGNVFIKHHSSKSGVRNYITRARSYRFNRLAQSLSRNDLVIGIILPVVWQEFYGFLKAGMDDMLSDLQEYHITEYHTVSNLYSHAEIIEGIRYFNEKNVDGIVI
jgi:DNA-binding LacI/PurR family transcriptional regulator